VKFYTEGLENMLGFCPAYLNEEGKPFWLCIAQRFSGYRL